MVLLRVLLLSVLGITVSGCINSTTLVRVKRDGSGTIEQSMLVNMAALKGMLAMGGAQTKESASVLNEADFKRAGERMGVRPVSLTPMKQGGFEGAKAIYAFDDITKIRLDQDPQMAGSSTGTFASASTTRNPITFGLTRRSGSSVLTISVDERAAEAATARAQDAPSLETIDPAMMQMIKTMFNGFRILVDLEVDGQIVKTNADYVDGSRITLLEVDMAGVFQDEAKLKALQSKVKPGVSIAELRPFLKDIQGVKINHPAVTIEFR